MSKILDITGGGGLSILAASDEALRRDAGMGLSEAWKLHEGGVRLYTGNGLVLGHYYRIEPDNVRVWGEASEFLRTRHIEEASVSYEEANGFFFFLGVGDYVGFLRHLQLSPHMQFGSGHRHGKLYVYSRKELDLYIKLKLRRSKCQALDMQ